MLLQLGAYISSHAPHHHLNKNKYSFSFIFQVMLAYFDSNEIRCWTDLEGYNNFPSLYMFNKQNGNIEFHYEILDEGKYNLIS